MKRQIKFRAWDGEQMHYNIVPWQWDFVISLAWHKCEKSTGTGILGSGGPTGEFLVPGIRFKELMQFTGLHDKNGKEIYEGDIISLTDDVGDEILVICEFGTVQREIYGQTLNLCDITGFYFRKDNRATFPIVNNYAGKHDLELFEVIGNIYENPELLDP